MKKIKKGNKRWLVIHINYYLKKKKIEKENKYWNKFEEDRQKLREYKKKFESWYFLQNITKTSRTTNATP